MCVCFCLGRCCRFCDFITHTLYVRYGMLTQTDREASSAVSHLQVRGIIIAFSTGLTAVCAKKSGFTHYIMHTDRRLCRSLSLLSTTLQTRGCYRGDLCRDTYGFFCACMLLAHTPQHQL